LVLEEKTPRPAARWFEVGSTVYLIRWQVEKEVVVRRRTLKIKFVRVFVLQFLRLGGIVWPSARIFALRPESLYLYAFASFSRDAIKRKKAP
jgi:hypothetical protein